MWTSAVSRLISLAATLAALAACSSENTRQITVRFKVAEGTSTGCALGTDCEDYPMRCGAKLMVRIVDNASNVVFGEICETVGTADLVDAGPPAGGLTLCQLKPKRTTTLRGIPFQMVRIQVAVWAPDGPGDVECPPSVEMFDVHGGLQSNYIPQPAFGGAVYFDMNSPDEDVWVPLRCSDVEQIDEDWCEIGTDTTRIVARVDDLATGITVSSQQATQLDVAAAPPRPVSATSPVEYQIENGELLHLMLESGSGGQPPSFAGDEPGAIEGTLCAVVDESIGLIDTVVCEEFAEGATSVDLHGIRVSAETIDDFLGLLGLPRFPELGMVIGRVLDHNGSPLEDVTLSVEDRPEVVIEYLNENRTAFDGTATASHGYFVSRNAPFGSVWHALHPDGRREAAGTLRTGVIHDRASPIILRMQPD